MPDFPCERVLVVNDDRDLVELIAEALREEGADVEVAVGAREAEDVLASGFLPDVVLVDLVLGDGVPGAEFIRRIRADPSLADVPVVAMSGSARDLARVDHEAHAILEKPFTRETLLEVVGALCEE